MRRFLLCISVFAWFAVSGLALADDSTSTTTAVPTEATAAETSADGATAEAAPAPLPKPQPLSLDELLEMVRLGFASEREENRQRERDFLARKEDQAQLLSEAEAVLAREEALSQQLEDQYNAYETEIGTREEQLTERVGALGELFGVVRQVSTDFSGQVWDSLISSQLGDRKELLDRLGRSKELPTTADLERLWFELQREITEQGKVVRYQAQVLTEGGDIEEREVIRAGPFSAFTDGRYLMWETREQQLRELTRQPPSQYLGTVDDFEETESGYAMLAVDPSRGSLLSALTDTPNWTERIHQGGYVGYAIIVLGLLALVLGVWRWVVIGIASRRVTEQQKHLDHPKPDNPLGRVLTVYQQNRGVDPETLELKLDEVVMRESSQIERFLWLVKTVSVVAPLMGLLGTVTGMIQTFQAITLFGAGDPKMMAGGISEALVTTMLGLITAIPLVLLHATLANSARRINDILEEQSTGFVAIESEGQHGTD
jgi:biopolymer transport protein ExbB